MMENLPLTWKFLTMQFNENSDFFVMMENFRLTWTLSSFFEQAEKESQQPLDGEEEGDERRGITYQIAKNKGLQPKRSKLQRNPRVKHRHKFEKAKIKRKGQVREVRKETKKYAGELSGINARVKKGVKIMWSLFIFFLKLQEMKNNIYTSIWM